MIELKIGDCVKLKDLEDYILTGLRKHSLEDYIFIVKKLRPNLFYPKMYSGVYLEPVFQSVKKEFEKYGYSFKISFVIEDLELAVPKNISFKIFEDKKYKDIFV